MGRAWRAREDKKGEVGAAHEKKAPPLSLLKPDLVPRKRGVERGLARRRVVGGGGEGFRGRVVEGARRAAGDEAVMARLREAKNAFKAPAL